MERHGEIEPRRQRESNPRGARQRGGAGQSASPQLPVRQSPRRVLDRDHLRRRTLQPTDHAPRLARLTDRELDFGRRLRGHQVRAVRRRHRKDHDQPPGSAQRVPAGDAHRGLRRDGQGARGHERRRDHPDRRRRQGLLLRRRPARARRYRLRGEWRRGRPLPRDRPAPADPPAAQARRRDGRGLRDRRRPRPAPRVRPHDRRRQRAASGRSAPRSAPSTAATARASSPDSSAPRRPRRSGSCAASTGPRKRARCTWSTRSSRSRSSRPRP